MFPVDIGVIEQEACRLRAEDLRRGEPVFAERTALYAHLLGASQLSVADFIGDALRPLFSWNPQAHGPHLS